MYVPEAILENETQKIPEDFAIETDLLISASQPDQDIFHMKNITCHLMNFSLLA